MKTLSVIALCFACFVVLRSPVSGQAPYVLDVNSDANQKALKTYLEKHCRVNIRMDDVDQAKKNAWVHLPSDIVCTVDSNNK
jgi:hypothetical protein